MVDCSERLAANSMWVSGWCRGSTCQGLPERKFHKHRRGKGLSHAKFKLVCFWGGSHGNLFSDLQKAEERAGSSTLSGRGLQADDKESEKKHDHGQIESLDCGTC